jgi:hypothetical protein
MPRNACGNGKAAGVGRANLVATAPPELTPRERRDRPDSPNLRVFKRNPANLNQSIT